MHDKPAFTEDRSDDAELTEVQTPKWKGAVCSKREKTNVSGGTAPGDMPFVSVALRGALTVQVICSGSITPKTFDPYWRAL